MRVRTLERPERPTETGWQERHIEVCRNYVLDPYPKRFQFQTYLF